MTTTYKNFKIKTTSNSTFIYTPTGRLVKCVAGNSLEQAKKIIDKNFLVSK